VKSMGYYSLNGASATAISALHKYGLLDKVGDEVKVSDRALRIMHPNSAGERREAIEEAAREPALFAELNERFPGLPPHEGVLRNFLIRKGFSPTALSSVLLAYRKTSEFVTGGGSGYDQRAQSKEEPLTMHTATHVQTPPPPADTVVADQGNERRIGVIDLAPGSYVRIMATPDIDPAEALEWAEEIITLQRRVLAKRQGRMSEGKTESNFDAANTEEISDPDA
jgi:hypothetical protein